MRVCAALALTVLACVGLLAVAVLAQAPPPALPFVAFICIGFPVLASWDVPASVAVLRHGRSRALDDGALEQLRRRLDQLPETPHPLGF